MPSAEARKKPPKAHDARLKELHEKVDSALAAAEITPEQREEFGNATKAVVGRMTPTALERVHKHVKEVKYYDSHEDLTRAFKAKYPKLKLGKDKVIKGALDRDGTLHLDGGGLLFRRPASLEEFHAHEFSHAIDGTNHEISESEAWKAAWEEEIRSTDYLSDDAKRSPAEGFAEFGIMILTGMTAKDVAEIFPKCVKVWKKEKIV